MLVGPLTYNNTSAGTNRAIGIVGRGIPRRDVEREPITSVEKTVKDVEFSGCPE